MWELLLAMTNKNQIGNPDLIGFLKQINIDTMKRKVTEAGKAIGGRHDSSNHPLRYNSVPVVDKDRFVRYVGELE